MKRLSITIAIVLLSGVSCNDYLDILKESVCIRSPDAEVCEGGEGAGTLPGSGIPHCCENGVLVANDKTPCQIVGARERELSGHFAKLLDLEEKARIVFNFFAKERRSYHCPDQDHCENHEEECEEEVIAREWRISGTYFFKENHEARFRKLALELAEQEGFDPTTIEIRFNRSTSDTEIVQSEKLAPICEEKEHLDCSQALEKGAVPGGFSVEGAEDE